MKSVRTSTFVMATAKLTQLLFWTITLGGTTYPWPPRRCECVR